MATKSVKNIREQAVRAALDLAAEKGWAAVGLQDIASRAGLSLAALRDQFDDRLDIIAAWGRLIDARVLEAAGKPDPQTSPRDRLFDILMERFEVLNEHRDGALAVLRALKTDPAQAIIALPHLGRSMGWMLEAAGIETGGVRGAAKIAGLVGLYLKTLWVWCDDGSPDLGETMAALDKNLERAERWAGRFGETA